MDSGYGGKNCSMEHLGRGGHRRNFGQCPQPRSRAVFALSPGVSEPNLIMHPGTSRSRDRKRSKAKNQQPSMKKMGQSIHFTSFTIIDFLILVIVIRTLFF